MDRMFSPRLGLVLSLIIGSGAVGVTLVPGIAHAQNKDLKNERRVLKANEVDARAQQNEELRAAARQARLESITRLKEIISGTTAQGDQRESRGGGQRRVQAQAHQVWRRGADGEHHGVALPGHVDQADEDVLNTNTRLRGDTFGNGLVEGLFHLNRTTSVPSDLNKDNAGCVGNPQVAFRWVHKLVVGVTIDNLKLVVRRDVGDVNHGVVNHFAHGANGFSGSGLGEINSNERHCCLSMKLGSYAVK